MTAAQQEWGNNVVLGELRKTKGHMKVGSGFVLAFLFGFGTACYAGEASKDSGLEALTSTQLGDYSLKLDTDEPRNIGVPDPSGLTPLKQETVKPFLGLKLSRPLPDNFWNFAR